MEPTRVEVVEGIARGFEQVMMRLGAYSVMGVLMPTGELKSALKDGIALGVQKYLEAIKWKPSEK